MTGHLQLVDLPPGYDQEFPPFGDLNEAPQPSNGPLIRWYGDDDPEPPRWLVRGLLPERQIGIVSGQWSAGKTTVAMDVSFSVMTGETFAGHEVVRTGAVLWLGAEGASEIDIRLKAAALHRSDEDQVGRLPFARQAHDVPVLTESDAFTKLIAIVNETKAGLAERFPDSALAMIVVDTLASAAGFQDENSASETQRVMSMLRRLSDAADALVLIIDHHGKAAETGVRGSSAKSGAADAILAALCDKDQEGEIGNRRLAVVKLRAGATGATFPFALKPIAVDEWGNTSCGVEWTGPVSAKPDRAAKPAWSGQARLFKTAMVHAMIDKGERKRPFGFEAPEVKAVTFEQVRIEFYARYPGEMATKRKAFHRFVSDASGKGLIASRDIGGTDWLWFLDDAAAIETQRATTAA